LLAVQVQGNAAGAEQLQVRRSAQPFGEQWDDLQDVLAVVDHQQQAARRQIGFDGLFQRLAGSGA